MIRTFVIERKIFLIYSQGGNTSVESANTVEEKWKYIV